MDKDVTSAKQCINCLNSLLRRLYPLEKTEWLEQALVTRVYITGKYPPIQTADGIKDLKRLLDGPAPLTTLVLISAEVRRNLTAPISSKAICSVQIVLPYFPSFKTRYVFETYGELLWKISDSYFTKRQFEEALAWSLLAHHGLLDQSTSNDAKIVRRIIRCLIELQRPGEANDYFPQIRETPAHALTFVLQFQVAVRCNDDLLGPIPFSTYLYGAV